MSERRAFVDKGTLRGDSATHLARTTKTDGSQLRVLREADKVRLERFALSTSLSSLERLATLLDPKEARAVARKSQKRIRDVLDGKAEWIVEVDLVCRLLGLALRTEDRTALRSLVAKMRSLWSSVEGIRTALSELPYHGSRIDATEALSSLVDYLQARRLEATAAAIDVWNGGLLERSAAQGIAVDGKTVTAMRVRSIAKLYADADLRAVDREDDWRARTSKRHVAINDRLQRLSPELERRFVDIRRFIDINAELGDRVWTGPAHRMFLSTRPPSYFDIARRLLYKQSNSGFDSGAFTDLLRVVNAVRGTQYNEPVASVVDGDTIKLPSHRKRANAKRVGDPLLILGNLCCDEDWWLGAASYKRGASAGKPILTFARFRGLADVIDKAQRARRAEWRRSREVRPTLLVLPELSLPRAWVRAIGNYVARSGEMALIAGLEYLHDTKKKTVANQVVGVFPGPMSSVITVGWNKELPARDEARQLQGLPTPIGFEPRRSGRPRRLVVESEAGAIAVLICSELLEARRVANVLGRVEVLLVPSWNKDTSSYDHMIQSVGLHLNAIVGVANNGQYSDCRMWAPLEERWQRDGARLISRERNEVVVVPIPLQALREFRAGRKPKVKWKALPPDWP